MTDLSKSVKVGLIGCRRVTKNPASSGNMESISYYMALFFFVIPVNLQGEGCLLSAYRFEQLSS